ncbi:bifunctional diguanylate cyclase/phosphodiesterase [Actinoplanes sp. L3-i22]|uniref:putative bifunctional diguanylate cyclase/phosphodiesterase n=1 Tax=Actinoplanes sp. L3-i22 TaxID=2836373 RepID=UPI0021022D15|nr:bifunctional diguanylate cyclase/phosphodiesterase [Actinoplanes sp. L3-i22]
MSDDVALRPVRPAVRAIAAWLLAGLSLPAAALVGTLRGAPASTAYLIVTLICVLAGAAGVRHNLAAGQRRPWVFMLAAQGLSVAGQLIRVVPGGPAPVANALLLPSYLLLTAGVLDLLRRSRAAEDEPARVDAVLLGLGSTLVVWSLWVEDWLAGPDPRWPDLVAAVLPLAAALLVIIVLPMLLLGRVRAPAMWFFAAGGAALLAGDVLIAVRGWVPDGPGVIGLNVIGAAMLIAYATNSACMLHPTVVALTERVQSRSWDLRTSRTAAITAALCAPTVLAVVAPPDTTTFALVRAALSLALIATAVARIVRANNSRARAETQALWQAGHDALTGLPNRESLTTTLAGWDAREVSVLFLDLDRFQLINDHWGHEVGDELLQAVAGRIRGEVRAEDLLCRVGGDEFLVALTEPAEPMAARLLAALAAPVPLSVGSVDVTASIGIARSAAVRPSQDQRSQDQRSQERGLLGRADAVELIRDADTAMYRAKSSGRNRYTIFDLALRDRIRTRIIVERALRGALANGELDVHYQPIVDLRTDRVDGFEALMRWTHPELGAVSPVEFIPIAEDTGLIVESGAWLLAEASTRMRDWRAGDDGPRHVSVNLSVRQLREPGLADRVADILTRTGLPPDGLWLEVTESGLMEDLDSCLAALHQLRDLGITLCIDDFGTGYSSLSYLQRLPVAIVKIDRAFIAGVGDGGADESIVRAVLAMSQALGHRVVAEGVETAAQRDWLRANGCDFAQGWLYGRPQPADAIRLTTAAATAAASAAEIS